MARRRIERIACRVRVVRWITIRSRRSAVDLLYRLVLQQHFVIDCLSSLVVAGSGAVLVVSSPGGPGPGGGAAGVAVIRCARRRRTSASVTGMRPLPGLLGRSRR